MRVLVTRPLPQGEALAQRLRAAGHEVLLCPLLTIEWLENPPDLTGVGALAFTSANGVEGFARLSAERGLPVFCVGAASARAAEQAGFQNVTSAEGDAHDLLALIGSRREAVAGCLLHASGEDLAFDLAGALREAGIEARRAVVYCTKPLERLPDAVRTALAGGDVDKILFYSPRTGATFVALSEREGLGERYRTTTACCLSDAVAAAVNRLSWSAVRVAEQPTQESLLELLSDQAADG